ncbi:MAG: VWA domain-containing protein [Candidatus Aminicenantaceae bacterium]
MKKTAFLVLVILLSLSPFAQEQHEVSVINIEVPVRVMSGSNFVDTLNAEDFEIYENGELQKLSAFYLVRNTQLERQDGASWSTPNTARRFYMLFQFLEYNPQINAAFDHFFQNVIQPNDTLTIMTPMKQYDLSREALQNQSPEKLSRDLQTVVRKDTKVGAGDYNTLLSDLKMIVRSISSQTGALGGVGGGTEASDTGAGLGVEFQLPRYRETLERLDQIRMVNEQKFLAFAGQMKRLDAQKVVIFFYQREFRPEIESRILNLLMSQYQDQHNIMSAVQDLFTMYSRNNPMDVERLSQAFSDSATMFNFIFMNKEPDNVRGITMREQSEDVFNTFVELAAATGGIVDNSQNPEAGFRNAAQAASDYYLLYYSPANYQKDGTFKKITVKIKSQDYKINHRSGYYAN